MDFSLTSAQEAVAEAAAAIFGPRGHLTEPDSAESWVEWGAWREMAESELLGISLPPDVGGSGHGLLELCSLLQEVGRHLVRVPAAWALAVGAAGIDRFGSGEQCEGLLPRVIDGTALVVPALFEGISENHLAVRTSAERAGEQWAVWGEKQCVPFADSADVVLTPVCLEGGDVAVVALDPGADGVALDHQPATNGQPEHRVQLHGVLVDDGQFLGKPGEGLEVLGWLWQRAVIALCAVQLGVAEEVLRMTAAYTTTREQFGRPIATFQAVAMRAADAHIDVESMRATLWQAAWRVAHDLPAERAVMVAKLWAAEGGQRVAAGGHELHGGLGVDLDYPLHGYTRWAKHLELALGGSGQHAARLGADLARHPLG